MIISLTGGSNSPRQNLHSKILVHIRMPMTSDAEGATRVPAVPKRLTELRTGVTETKENVKKAE